MYPDDMNIVYQTTDGVLPDLTKTGSGDLVQTNVLQPGGTPAPPGAPVNIANLRNVVRRETVIEALCILARTRPDVSSIEAGLFFFIGYRCSDWSGSWRC